MDDSGGDGSHLYYATLARRSCFDLYQGKLGAAPRHNSSPIRSTVMGLISSVGGGQPPAASGHAWRCRPNRGRTEGLPPPSQVTAGWVVMERTCLLASPFPAAAPIPLLA